MLVEFRPNCRRDIRSGPWREAQRRRPHWTASSPTCALFAKHRSGLRAAHIFGVQAMRLQKTRPTLGPPLSKSAEAAPVVTKRGATIGPASVTFGPMSADLGPMSARLRAHFGGQSRSDLGPMWDRPPTSSGEIGQESTKHGPMLLYFGPSSARNRSNSTHICRVWLGPVQVRVDLGRVWIDLGSIWANIGAVSVNFEPPGRWRDVFPRPLIEQCGAFAVFVCLFRYPLRNLCFWHVCGLHPEQTIVA